MYYKLLLMFYVSLIHQFNVSLLLRIHLCVALRELKLFLEYQDDFGLIGDYDGMEFNGLDDEEKDADSFF